jgi:hypothetical protein
MLKVLLRNNSRSWRTGKNEILMNPVLLERLHFSGERQIMMKL